MLDLNNLQQEVFMALTLAQVGNNEYSVGSFEAKTYFAELLRKVQEGCVINITKNGKNKDNLVFLST